MTWGNFDTTNERKTLSGPGVCMAMSCKWTYLVLASAPNAGAPPAGIKDFKAVRDQVIKQQDYENLVGEKGDTFMFKAHKVAGKKLPLKRPTSVSLLAGLRGHQGTYLFSAFGKGGGHAMGIYHDGAQSWVFFDPNVGQRCFALEKVFATHLVSALKDYSDLKVEWEYYQMARA